MGPLVHPNQLVRLLLRTRGWLVLVRVPLFAFSQVVTGHSQLRLVAVFITAGLTRTGVMPGSWVKTSMSGDDGPRRNRLF